MYVYNIVFIVIEPGFYFLQIVVPVSLDIYQESLQLSLSRLLLFSGGRDEGIKNIS